MSAAIAAAEGEREAAPPHPRAPTTLSDVIEAAFPALIKIEAVAHGDSKCPQQCGL